jgi:hypothetical protein
MNKMIIFAMVIERDDRDDNTEQQPVPDSNPNSPDKLLRQLQNEVQYGRNSNVWRIDEYGTVFKG